MSGITITVGNEEYVIFDENITGNEVAFASFSGYMSFSGQVTEEIK